MNTIEELVAARDAARDRGDKPLSREIDLELARRGYEDSSAPAPPVEKPPLEDSEGPGPEETTSEEPPERTVAPKPKARPKKNA